MTQALLGAGASLASSNEDSPLTFAPIPEVRRISGPSQTAPEVEATHLGSTSVERIAGLPDRGSISFDMNLIPGDSIQQRLLDDLQDHKAREYELSYPDSPATVQTFIAIVTGYTPNLEPNAPMSASVTLAVSGDIETN